MTRSAPSTAFGQRLLQMREAIPDTVRLIAVTKQVSVEAMRAAYAAGLRDFGESRIQEAAGKQAALQDLTGVTWHLIGHLQHNKAQKALEQFQWIHSVDSLKLAQRLDRLAAGLPQPPQICLQVKLLPDPNKFGWTVPELLAELPQLDQLTHLQVRGLMAIAPLGLTPDETLHLFMQVKELADSIGQKSWQRIRMDQLSMGMSDDYPLAIQAGATMIRLGRILFGDRET